MPLLPPNAQQVGLRGIGAPAQPPPLGPPPQHPIGYQPPIPGQAPLGGQQIKPYGIANAAPTNDGGLSGFQMPGLLGAQQQARAGTLAPTSPYAPFAGGWQGTAAPWTPGQNAGAHQRDEAARAAGGQEHNRMGRR